MSPPSDASLDMIMRLVAFDTTSHKSNLAMVEYIQDYLAGFGVASEKVFDETRGKANLYATLGPQDRPGVALSGHTDVVPTEGQDWDSDPYTVVERDGRLYGRGTADMKSFIAVILAMVPEILAQELHTPVHLAFSYDEEVGCIGVRRLLAMLEDLSVRPAGCIIGEPTEMKVVNGHKGKRVLRGTVRGHACHSAYTPDGVNAVEYGAEIVARLRHMAGRLRTEGPFDERFDPPFTTIHTGTIAGGTALNIVPEACSFEFEMRNLPGHDMQPLVDEIQSFAATTLEPEMQAVSEAAGVSWSERDAYPALDTPEDSDVVRLAKALSRNNDVGTVSFGTEAGLFRETGIPAVVCGPGSIAQAHKPNEFIALDQVAACEAFVRRLIAHVSAPAT